jgi:hypothetical protein
MNKNRNNGLIVISVANGAAGRHVLLKKKKEKGA